MAEYPSTDWLVLIMMTGGSSQSALSDLLGFCKVQLLDEVTKWVGPPDEQQITAQAVPPDWKTDDKWTTCTALSSK